MYIFHYDYIKNNYGNNSRLFTDTDNLMYEIKTEDAYEVLVRTKECLNFTSILLRQNIMVSQKN